jgi:hypothetical protein
MYYELWRIPPEKEGVSIYTVAFKPSDGSLIAAAKGKQLLVYNLFPFPMMAFYWLLV